MKLPLPIFRRDRSIVRGGDTQDRAEKLLADSFRMLGEVCQKMAEFIEMQRLQRSGYASQDPLLKRLDTHGAPPPEKE
jgi:hypothetical protein